MNEHEHQATLVRWARLYEREIPELWGLYANPLGGYRPMTTARSLKQEGVKPGVPDLTLPVARNGYHGLYIEMKKPKEGRSAAGIVTEPQHEWLEFLKGQGYKAVVCYGWVEAADTICDYLLGMTMEEYSEFCAGKRTGNRAITP